MFSRNKIWCIMIPILIFFLFIALLVNIAFKTPAPFPFMNAEWDVNAAIGFCGSMGAALATIFGVYLTLNNSQEQHREETRKKVLPYFSLVLLNTKSFQKLPNALEYRKMLKEKRQQKDNFYNEFIPKEVCFIIQENKIDVISQLSDRQLEQIKYGAVFFDNGNEFGFTGKYPMYMPFELENVGQGIAISVIIEFEKKGGSHKRKRIAQIPLGSKFRINIFAEEFGTFLLNEYYLRIVYNDIYGNQYTQEDTILFVMNSESNIIPTIQNNINEQIKIDLKGANQQ